MSLVGSVLQGLSPEVISRMASGLGAPQGAIEKGVGAAAPAILAALVGATRTDSDIAALSAALSQAKAQTDTDFSSMSGGRFRDVADAGGEALSSVIGGGQMGVLASKLRDFAGLPEGSSGALLGAVNSVVMRNLGTTATAHGLDGRALVDALNAEKSAIARALPGDFAKTLAGAGLIESVTDHMGIGSVDPVAPAPRAPEPRPAVVRPAEPRPAEYRPAAAVRPEPVVAEGRPWWHWVAGLAALGLLAWLGSNLLRGTPEPEVVRDTATEATTTATATVVDASEVAATATGLFDRLGKALDGVTDEATARTAAPALAAIKDDLVGLQTSVGALSAEGRSTVQGIVATALPAIKAGADRLLGNSGIAAVLKPTLDEITKTISRF
jgi:hypothetical protein